MILADNVDNILQREKAFCTQNRNSLSKMIILSSFTHFYVDSNLYDKKSDILMGVNDERTIMFG